MNKTVGDTANDQKKCSCLKFRALAFLSRARREDQFFRRSQKRLLKTTGHTLEKNLSPARRGDQKSKQNAPLFFGRHIENVFFIFLFIFFCALSDTLSSVAADADDKKGD
jgi:hypothetical protein